jgi:hypothetical protein
MFLQRKCISAALAFALPVAMAARCSSADGPPPGEDPATLPLLGAARPQLYVQEAYEVFPDDVTEAVAGRYAELVASGMDNARHLFDWGELEPEPGVYDTESVIAALAARQATGIEHQFCNITVIDSAGPEALPQYVVDLLEAGVPWDDPQITDAFAGLLDAIVPLMADRGVYMLGIANEPGGYYEDAPEQAASFAGFVAAAVERIHDLNPRLATTVVFAGSQDPSISALLPLVDVATFNQYAYDPEPEPACQFEGFTMDLARAAPPEAIGGLLDGLIAVAQGKLICIQEWGQATGWNDEPETLGPEAGLAQQRQMILALAEALQARRAYFRTVCIWTLNDHTPAGIQYLVDALLAEGLPACYVANLAESFGPTGLVRSDAIASAKPAFQAFRAALADLAGGCGVQSGVPARQQPVGPCRPKAACRAQQLVQE